MSCVIGWACEEVNAKQIEGYELSDHVHIVNPGDGAAANADLYGAYEKGEPWLGYQWGTNDPTVALDLVTLNEPEYSDECWFTTKACAYEPATILIAVHPDLITQAPDVVAMLRAWDLDIERYKAVGKWRYDNKNATVNDTALWWLKNNTDVWSVWVTDDAEGSHSRGTRCRRETRRLARRVTPSSSPLYVSPPLWTGERQLVHHLGHVELATAP